MKEDKRIGFKEFIALMAMMIALTALAIDAMLPALSTIGKDLGVTSANDNQLIISTLFLGLSIGHLIYGPLSDSFGRKPAVYLGFLVFIIGCLLSVFSDNLTVMLVGRCVQGIGLAGPRTTTMAIVRDLYKGDKMAQVMSFVMVTFIVLPIIAPTLGQIVLSFTSWRMLFVLFIVLALATFIWFAIRQQETLAKEKRVKYSLKNLAAAFKEVMGMRSSMFYTLAAGFVSSAFITLLNSSQQIFQIQFELGERFPRYFALIALSVGVASFVNGNLVMRFGMQKMVKTAAIGAILTSGVFFTLMNTVLPTPPLYAFMIYMCSTLLFIGILFGNLTSMAMEPLGHIAGLGSAVVGSLSTLISVPLGTYIGMQYDGTVKPLVTGFLLFAILTAVSIFAAKDKRVNPE